MGFGKAIGLRRADTPNNEEAAIGKAILIIMMECAIVAILFAF